MQHFEIWTLICPPCFCSVFSLVHDPCLALALQAKAAINPRHLGKGYVVQKDHLNKWDIYVMGFRSERHTFVITLSDGETKVYGHTLRYLPHHKDAKGRWDVGRRGVRAMVLLTRAVGGDKYYTGILK